MSEAFTKWDAADHLRTPEDIRLYLEACAEEDPGDGSLLRAALHDIARAGNMSRLAREAGMHAPRHASIDLTQRVSRPRDPGQAPARPCGCG